MDGLAPDPWNTPGMAEGDADRLRMGYAAFNHGGVEAILESLDPHDPRHGAADDARPRHLSRPQGSKLFPRMLEVFDEVQYEVEEVIDRGTLVAVVLRQPVRGRGSGINMGARDGPPLGDARGQAGRAEHLRDTRAGDLPLWTRRHPRVRVGRLLPMRLIFTSGPREGQAVDIDGTPMTIGRVEDNDLQIADDKVSRHHAVIQLRTPGTRAARPRLAQRNVRRRRPARRARGS